MSKRFPVFLALGAGLAFAAVWNQRRRQERALQWTKAEAQGQPGSGGPGVAAITGASAGIGETFARALARQGYHLLLIARREERLRALAEDLQRSYPVQVEVLAADLSRPEAVERAAARLAEVPNLGLLINNAGFGTGGKFVESDIEPELRMIQVHVSAAVQLTRAALPGMIQRGHGGIINVSSIAGLTTMPGNATYGSTKSYLIHFTESLHAELHSTGVRVQALCPGFTMSEFHDVAHVDRSVVPSFLWMQPGPVVAESLQGLREGQVVVIPGRFYRLLAFAMRLPLVKPLSRLVQEYRLKQQWKGRQQVS